MFSRNPSKSYGSFLLAFFALFSTVTSAERGMASGQDSSQAQEVISFGQLSEYGRPANFYRLDEGSPRLCGPLVKALNEPFKAEHRRPQWYSNLLLKSPMSVAWQDVELIGNSSSIEASKVDLLNTGDERWVFREINWNEPLNGNGYLLLPEMASVTLSQLRSMSPRELRGVIRRGSSMNNRRLTDPNDILPFTPKASAHAGPDQRFEKFLHLWDVANVNGQIMVLSIELRDEQKPQPILLRAHTMASRHEGTLSCLVGSQKPVAGINF